MGQWKWMPYRVVEHSTVSSLFLEEDEILSNLLQCNFSIFQLVIATSNFVDVEEANTNDSSS